MAVFEKDGVVGAAVKCRDIASLPLLVFSSGRENSKLNIVVKVSDLTQPGSDDSFCPLRINALDSHQHYVLANSRLLFAVKDDPATFRKPDANLIISVAAGRGPLRASRGEEHVPGIIEMLLWPIKIIFCR
jgi:hypothetical protein